MSKEQKETLMNMKYSMFLGFKNGKLETIILSKCEEREDAIDCDYYIEVEDPHNAEKNLRQWLKDRDANGSKRPEEKERRCT